MTFKLLLIAPLLASSSLPQYDVKAIKEKFQGPVIPVLTNYLEDGITIDTDAITANVKEVISRGIVAGDGVLLAVASGGDFPRLNVTQRKLGIETIVKAAAGKVPVIASIQHSDVTDIIALAKFAESVGADAVQVSPPYYYPCSLEDFNTTLRLIFEATKSIPLMVYNTPWEYNPPSGSSMDLNLEALQTLAKQWPRLVALKWATNGDSNNYQHVVHGMSDRLAIIDNADLQVMNYILGGTGFITHFANVWPEWNIKVHRMMKSGQFKEAQEEIATVYWPWSTFRGKIFGRTALESPVVKAALDLLGRPGGAVARPNRKLTEAELDELYAILKTAGVPGLKPRVTGASPGATTIQI